jgi:hypothetical protein
MRMQKLGVMVASAEISKECLGSQALHERVGDPETNS